MQGIIPIRTLLDAGSFNPDEINMLIGVLEDALRELQLNDANDHAATFIAQRIISLARRGERDPVRLRQHAVLTTFSD
jgi:predicted RNA-binding protein associated with RNAse of E/G family